METKGREGLLLRNNTGGSNKMRTENSPPNSAALVLVLQYKWLLNFLLFYSLNYLLIR